MLECCRHASVKIVATAGGRKAARPTTLPFNAPSAHVHQSLTTRTVTVLIEDVGTRWRDGSPCKRCREWKRWRQCLFVHWFTHTVYKCAYDSPHLLHPFGGRSGDEESGSEDEGKRDYVRATCVGVDAFACDPWRQVKGGFRPVCMTCNQTVALKKWCKNLIEQEHTELW